MAAATLALQAAIHAALTADVTLTSVLGGQKIFDHVPRRMKPPYVAIASSVEDDWSTGTETGSDHTVTLQVWSDLAGRSEAERIMAIVKDALHDRALTLVGFRLVNLRHQRSESRRLSEGDRFQGIMRFRAKTEELV